MKSRSLVTGLLILALAGWVAYSRYVPGHAPPGQPRVANLDPAGFERTVSRGRFGHSDPGLFFAYLSRLPAGGLRNSVGAR